MVADFIYPKFDINRQAELLDGRNLLRSTTPNTIGAVTEKNFSESASSFSKSVRFFTLLSPLALAGCGGEGNDESVNSNIHGGDGGQREPIQFQIDHPYFAYDSVQINPVDGGRYTIEVANQSFIARGGDSIFFSETAETVNLPFTGILQKTALDVSNVNFWGRDFWTPAAGGNVGKARIIALHDGDYLVVPVTFDKTHGEIYPIGTPFSGEIWLFPFDGVKFGELQTVQVNGVGTPYGYDVDNDGVNEIVMVSGGEDGRHISSIEDVATRALVFDYETGDVVYFGDPAWMHGVGFADINYDGSPELIVAPIGYDPPAVSAVYDLSTLQQVDFDFLFNGSGEDNIPFGDLDGDGLLEFIETYTVFDAEDGSLYLNVYEIERNGTVVEKQSIEIGSLDGGEYTYSLWTQKDEYQTAKTGSAFGVNFLTFHRWHAEIVDIDGDGSQDFFGIFSLEQEPYENLTPAMDSGVDYGWPIHVVSIFGDGSDLNYDTLKVTQITSYHVGKGWRLFDFNYDGHLDLYTDNNLTYSGSMENVTSTLSNRIWINDSTGGFAAIGSVDKFSLPDNQFIATGEFSIHIIDDIPHLIGFSSALDGSNLSFISAPLDLF